MYIRVPREKVAPVDTGRTETVQHHVSQSAGPQNAAPVLQSVQAPTPASQKCRGDSGTISYAIVSVLQPCGSGDACVDAVETEPHLETLTQHVAAGLAVPGTSATDEVGSGSGITAVSEELVEVLR